MTPGYRALRESAAWMDVSGRGKIVLSGTDAARLLHALSTNHIQSLAPSQGCYAFFLDAQGHILADAYILRRAKDFLLDTEPELAGKLLGHLDRYIVADDVTLEEETAKFATLAVEGPAAEEVLRRLGIDPPQAYGSHVEWGSWMVVGAGTTGAGGWIFIGPAAQKVELVNKLEQAGALEATAEDARVVRLEHGKPRYEEDISEAHLPQETQALHAVHFNKGCYLGQEIVERVRSRGRVKRKLVRLEIEGTASPGSGTVFEGGQITSAAFSPALGKVVALAYVNTDLLEADGEIVVQGLRARIFPPWRPST